MPNEQPAATIESRAVVVDFGQEANRPGDATNAPGHDTEEVTSMPDKTNACGYQIKPARWNYSGARCAAPATHQLVSVEKGIVHFTGCEKHTQRFSRYYESGAVEVRRV